MNFEKMNLKQFESEELLDNELRNVKGGWCITGSQKAGGNDLIDDCGVTHYEDCTNSEDGACPS
jgi:hypothetical protein